MSKTFNQNLSQLESILLDKFNTQARQLGAELFLTIGEPAFETPQEIKDAAISAIQKGKTKYSLTPGSLDLRQEISAFEKRLNQAEYSVDEILVTSGASEALSIALTTILNPQDEVILLTPVYPQYQKTASLLGAKSILVDISANDFQVTRESLEAVITPKTKAIVINSPNNPTGTILNQESIQIIADLAVQYEFFIVSDECYNQIYFEEAVPAISAIRKSRDWLIVCQSFSKPYAMTGWRLGYIAASKAVIEQADKVHQYTTAAINSFVQASGITALNYNPQEMVATYKERRDYIYNRLLDLGLEVVKPEGAFYIFPSIKKYGLSSWEFCERLVKEEKVALLPGICFEAEGFIRISFCMNEEVITQSLDRLENFLARIENKSAVANHV